jgi:NitT/TauT family transport system substrate-binding protein
MRIVAFSASVLLALVFVTVPAARSQELPTVRLGMLQSTTDAPIYIAQQKGFFRQEGINVEIIPFDAGAAMIAPLGTGQLDIAAGSPSAGLYNAAARGIPIRIVADLGSDPPGYGFQQLAVRTDLVKSGRFKTLKDLKGLTFGANTPQSAATATLEVLLRKAGLTLDDVKRVYLSYPDQVVAMKNGSIDAAIPTEPSAEQMFSSGSAVKIVGMDAIYPDQEISVIMYGGRFIADHRDLGMKFMRGFLRGARYYVGALKGGKLAGPNADDVIRILVQETKIKNPAIFRAITPSWTNPNGRLNVVSLREDLDFFRRQGFIQGNPRVEDVVDQSFALEAARQLGPYRAAR